MKFTLSWLKQHLQTDAVLDDICERLTMIGLEVESIDDRRAFAPFVIAKIVSAQKHPQADKLKVLMVDTGKGSPVQVVCGAPNARVGLIGAFAAPGTHIPGLNVTLALSAIRGVESLGMMCSERELEISQDHDGIIDLPQDAPIGESFARYYGLDDPLIEINLTPNRPDCTSVFGIARDLAASGMGTLKPLPTPKFSEQGEAIGVTLDLGTDTHLCPGFGLRLIRNVKNGPSPKWLQTRLISIGLRPINALVDITNFMTFDQGRPLHVFDYAKVKGNLVVRRAMEGETVLALDGRQYALSSSNVVIADENGVESIGGVMGGQHSGCDEATTDVLIESALWDPLNIAKTGRSLGIITDARYRFERGVDPDDMIPGLDRATQMVLELCGGVPAKAGVTCYTAHVNKAVHFPFSEVKRLTGIDVARDEILGILHRLGFSTQGAGSGEVVVTRVPSWRPDIDGKADLVEEVMRIHGINKIAPVALASHTPVNGKILTTLQIRTRLAKRALAARGMLEAITWSFIASEQAILFGGGKPELKLTNPIASDMSDMRPSLLPGLLTAAQRNADKGFADVALFEVSGTYEDDTMSGQRRMAGGIRRATASLQGAGRLWSNAQKGGGTQVDVYDAKADALAVLEACGFPMSNLQIEPGAPDWYHPGRSGTIKMGPKLVIGHFGEFHPKTLAALDVSGALCGFEIAIDKLPELKRKASRTMPVLDLSPFQSVKRDYAFVVEREVEAQAIMRAALGADRKLITGVNVFDVFEGAHLGEGKKSIAIEVSIQPVDRTLTDEDFEGLTARIKANVEKTTGGVLRG